jgi:hypothetical protein
MARISKGILGGFSGKVGTVVGANWRGKDIIRSIPKPTKRQPSDLQMMQQMRFSKVIDFLQPIRHIQNLYFGSKSKFQSRFNQATSYVLKNAVEMQDDLPVIIPERVLITKGDLTGVQNLSVAAGSGVLEVSWDDNSGQGDAAASDKVNVICYCGELEAYLLFEEAAERDSTSASLSVAELYLDQELDVWVYLNTPTRNKASTSQYQGKFTVT